jgi:hypothetical protein
MLSSQAIQNYGKAIRALRSFTQASMNNEPSWRAGERLNKSKDDPPGNSV